MAQTDANDVTREVDRALGDLTRFVIEAAGGSFEARAYSFWREYYEPKFRSAIVDKKRTYDGDKRGLQLKARELGEKARSLAGDGPITRAHAEQATEVTRCQGIDIMEYWCS